MDGVADRHKRRWDRPRDPPRGSRRAVRSGGGGGANNGGGNTGGGGGNTGGGGGNTGGGGTTGGVLSYSASLGFELADGALPAARS